MIRFITALLLGCAGGEPTPLPPPRWQPPTASGAMVRVGSVQGYLATPRAQGPHPGTLLLVSAIDPTSQARALELATQGELTLAIAPPVPVQAASRYLDGMPGTTTTRTLCERPDCAP